MHATLAKRAPCECEIALRLLEFQARKPKGAASRDKCNIRSSLDRGMCPSQGAHQTVRLRSVRSPQCPSPSAALLSPSELHPRIRLASVETALHWPAVHWRKVISVLSASVTWERRWPQTSPPPDDG